MNKGDLINNVAKSADCTKVQAATAVDTVFESIEKALKKGDRVTLVGFGTFSVSVRKAREGRNPATGKTIKIPKKKVVRFKSGKGLSEKLN
ncbi:MAG: HU family DNA-binding protein [Saprospiraceae bacterium]|nr:HU family DNA-binding protein [Saprospiraceae bacterium]